MSEVTTLKDTSLIKNVLTSEVKFIIYVITIAIGVIAPYYGIKENIALIQKDISIINNNHMVHIQDSVKDIEEIKRQQLEQDKEIAENQKQMLLLLNKLDLQTIKNGQD